LEIIPPKSKTWRIKKESHNNQWQNDLLIFWCQYHQRWTIHKPQDCHLKAQMQTQTEPKPTETPALNKGKRDKKQGLAL
jgi:hypothetical protein